MKSIVRNPSRKKRKTKRKKRKMSALQLKYFGKKRSLKRAVKANPGRKKRSVSVMKRKKRKVHRKRHSVAAVRHHRKRKPNPSGGKFSIASLAMDGVLGIAGGVVNNVVAKLLSKFAPAGTNQTMMLNVLRIASAVGVSYAASRFLNRDQARAVGIGAIVGFGLPIAQQALPLAGLIDGYDESIFGATSADAVLKKIGLEGADLTTHNLSAGDDLGYDIDGFDEF